MTPCNVKVKGIGWTNKINECGTVCCDIKDDKGKPHKMVIPATYYNAKSPYHLLTAKLGENISQPRGHHMPNYSSEYDIEL